MWLLPKRLFQWTEPKGFRQDLWKVERAYTRWWFQPASAFLWTGLFLSGWLLAKWNPNKQPPPFWAALLVALVFGLFLAYVLLWFFSLCPASIIVFEDRLCRVVGNTNQVWKVADMRAYSWLDCPEYGLLVLEHRKGTQRLIGVPRKVSRTELENFFAARAIE